MPKMTRIIPASMYRNPMAVAFNEFHGFGEATVTVYKCGDKWLTAYPGMPDDKFKEEIPDECNKWGGGNITAVQVPASEVDKLPYGRPGDPWDNWCATAAAIWPNPAERGKWRHYCTYGNVLIPASGVEPWSRMGKVWRGLPQNFSNDPKEVGEGLVGAVVNTVTEVVKTGEKVVDTASRVVGGGGGTTSPTTPTVRLVDKGISMTDRFARIKERLPVVNTTGGSTGGRSRGGVRYREEDATPVPGTGPGTDTGPGIGPGLDVVMPKGSSTPLVIAGLLAVGLGFMLLKR
jgi:hypothetical protein